MKEDTFNYVWQNIIKPVIDSEYEKCRKNRECEQFKFKKLNESQIKTNIKDDYETVKQYLKNSFYKAKGDDSEENLIDTHKIAACLCYSVLRNKPFSFIVTSTMPEEIVLSNYYVAYHTSLAFVFFTLISEYEINGYPEYAKELKGIGKMMEPHTSVGHNTYFEGRIYALAQNDFYKNTFDVLGFADMMYWVELYTRQNIEKTFLPVQLDRIKFNDKLFEVK